MFKTILFSLVVSTTFFVVGCSDNNDDKPVNFMNGSGGSWDSHDEKPQGGSGGSW